MTYRKYPIKLDRLMDRFISSPKENVSNAFYTAVSDMSYVMPLADRYRKMFLKEATSIALNRGMVQEEIDKLIDKAFGRDAVRDDSMWGSLDLANIGELE